MALGGWSFTVLPAEIDESPLPEEDPVAYVLRLAESKAWAAAEKAPQEAILIAADTTVADQGQILGKPADPMEAKAMLRRLRGRTHQVHTALAVLRVSDGSLRSEVCTTNVTMRSYAEVEIDDYVKSGDPLDKAGAYAIQHPGFHPVEGLKGCYTNVVGLPVCRLTQLLRDVGVPPGETPFACLHTQQDECSITPEMLNGDL